MSDKLFFRGIMCAIAGLALSQIGGAIGHGREPAILVPVLVLCLMGWLWFTVAAFIVKESD